MDTNGMRLLIYFSLLAMTIPLLINAAGKRKMAHPIRQYFYFCANLTGWLVMEILFHILQSPRALRCVFELKLGFVAFCAVNILFAIGGFFRLNRLLPRYSALLLYAIPAVTAVLAVLDPFHSLLLKSFAITATHPVTTAVYQLGPWYYIHMIYSQCMALGILLILLRYYHTLPAAHRRGSWLMFLGITIYGLCALLCRLGLDRNTLDYNLIGSCLGGFFYYLATLAHDRPSYLHIERREVFHYLDEAVFILSGDGNVADINRPAQQLLDRLGRPPYSGSFAALLDRLAAEGKIIRRQQPGQPHEDLYIPNGRFPLVYELHRQQFHGNSTPYDAQFVVLTDVTNNRLVIDRLQEMAGFDTLTGLSNRHGYLETLRQWDTAESLPLSIVMGDVNNLKTINDTFGHAKGDELLQTVARSLLACCPENGHVARIGGDEFILLLPQRSRGEAVAIMEDIRQVLGQNLVADRPPSIAMGCATKSRPDQNINQLIAVADKLMYANKKEESIPVL